MYRYARMYEYLDHVTVEELLKEHMQGIKNRRLLIWSLLSLEAWLKTFLAGD